MIIRKYLELIRFPEDSRPEKSRNVLLPGMFTLLMTEVVIYVCSTEQIFVVLYGVTLAGDMYLYFHVSLFIF